MLICEIFLAAKEAITENYAAQVIEMSYIFHVSYLDLFVFALLLRGFRVAC